MQPYYINCGHYTRGCQFVSPCCLNIVRCRFCHDDTYVDHQINRFEICEIVCNNCSLKQPISNKCIGCEIQFGEYYCEICRLYICDKKTDIFHCAKCKICRIGNKDTIHHCDICGICYNIENKDSHKCNSDIAKIDCVICSQDLFTSTKSYFSLPCGHILHLDCATEWMKRSIGCPLCRKTIIDGELLLKYIENIDKLISQFSLENQEIINAYCNDCNKNFDVNYHPFGLKCSYCSGYNTK
jgi:RING finger/CHY zinc finger protein 1